LRGNGLSIGVHNDATHIYDESDRLLVLVREPLLVSVPGEAERLLGVSMPPPIFWVELALAGLPQTEPVARHCAEALTARYDGMVWNP
jgi:hypothetical protein